MLLEVARPTLKYEELVRHDEQTFQKSETA